MTSFFDPVLPYHRLDDAEKAPGARILSSVLKLLRKLFTDTLLLKLPFELGPSRLRPMAPGVLEMLLAGLPPGVPYVLYEKPKPRF
jgi:hypothetical protein